MRGAIPILLLLSALPAVRGDEIRDPARHFTFTIPDDWAAIPEETLRLINQELASRNLEMKVSYFAGYRPKNIGWPAYPYILLQERLFPPGSSAPSYERLEKEMGAITRTVEEQKAKLGDMMKDLKMNKPVLDRAKNRLVLALESNVQGVGDVKGISIGFLGSRGLTQLHAYATSATFQTYSPQFERIFDSFKYDPGYTFVPGSDGIFNLGGALEGGIRGGIIGGLIGAGFAVVILVLKKLRQ